MPVKKNLLCILNILIDIKKTMENIASHFQILAIQIENLIHLNIFVNDNQHYSVL